MALGGVIVWVVMPILVIFLASELFDLLPNPRRGNFTSYALLISPATFLIVSQIQEIEDAFGHWVIPWFLTLGYAGTAMTLLRHTCLENADTLLGRAVPSYGQRMRERKEEAL